MKVVFFLTLVCQWNNVFSGSISAPNFNDPLYPLQFHLNERYGVTMNIHKAWKKGLTGKGVTICVNDPAGVDKNHDDLSSKFVVEGSFDYKTNSSDPTPDGLTIYDGPLSYGTAMAGLALAKANNGKCIVGVAYDAKFSGIKHLRGSSTDPSYPNRFAHLIQYAHHVNDIYLCSWGPPSSFGYVQEPIKAALKNATEKGRGGKGSIYMFSAGNSGLFNGSCAFNEYITSVYTIGISLVTGKNVRSYHNMACPSIHAVTYSRDLYLGLKYPHDRMPSCALQNKCKENTGSSYGANAVAAGIIALVLQANPNLGWRDVQHLIARSSCSQFSSVQWNTNKAGFKYSDYFGFGLLDADAVTTNAKNWTNVGKQLECVMVLPSTPRRIDGVATITEVVDLSSWPSLCGGEGGKINFLEHVVLQFSLNFTNRRNIEIEIESPGGSRSVLQRSGWLLDLYPTIPKINYLQNLSIKSLQFWGENPRGKWKIRLRNIKPNPKQNGTLYNWSVKLYGTASDPMAGNTVVASQIKINQTSTASPPTTNPCPSKNSRPCGSTSTKAPSLMIAALVLFSTLFSNIV
ncbi:proprotein convertase subtilisin/kexin type 6-like isoform X3 [Rhopilema esculentum]|uniref:proprotein convertase subtilisin/kexin type 6-like isoform X3 n=1 Tax=Rhopilema esculentum TaxID=499914 RepID=UPI0031D01FFA